MGFLNRFSPGESLIGLSSRKSFFLQKDPTRQLPLKEEKLCHNQVFPRKSLHFGICLRFYIIFSGKETIVFKKTISVMLRLQHTVLRYYLFHQHLVFSSLSCSLYLPFSLMTG